ncbi:hypothetical protein EK21DRAFT_62064 [Setomelanomma holmii]|uniref:Lytic polysaccharide monooxygenase n=1 Tax=Setomelanomma holmii TaxID=210430 RepID=A0A9P4HEV8_9PLEO|nr:hypothetical protein EK21DRAFT_62064 [Setomelanomma holmii]
MFSSTTVLAAILAVAPMTANAHMNLERPVPFLPAVNSSPLEIDGSDFPCKMGAGGFQVKTMNNWTVGSTQNLMLNGSAVHDGGSCQISVSADKIPTKASKWKVIYSIEGGCPPAPPEAHPELYQAPGWNGFDFTVPPDLPNGEMTMAWTWSNAMGNREFYMNCAPISISGSSDDKTAFEALPDMQLASIDALTECDSVEQPKNSFHGYAYLNPGKYVTRLSNKTLPTLCGESAAGGAGSTPAATQPANSPVVSSQAPMAPVVSSQAPVPTPLVPTPTEAAVPPAGDKQTSTSRIILTVTASTGPKPTPINGTSAAGPPKSSPPLSQAGTLKPSSQAPAASSAAPPAGSGALQPAGGDVQTCTTDGAVVCSPDGTKFGLCNCGKAVMQAVSGGMQCKDNAVVGAKRGEPATTLKTVYA